MIIPWVGKDGGKGGGGERTGPLQLSLGIKKGFTIILPWTKRKDGGLVLVTLHLKQNRDFVKEIGHFVSCLRSIIERPITEELIDFFTNRNN